MSKQKKKDRKYRFKDEQKPCPEESETEGKKSPPKASEKEKFVQSPPGDERPKP